VSKIVLTYTGTTKNQSLKIRNRETFIKEVLNCFPESELIITVKKKGRKRSLLQNNLYWAVYVPEITKALINNGYAGFTQLDVHHYLKNKFNSELSSDKNGEIIEIGTTTTQLTRTEFAEYMIRIKTWAKDALDINIPEPNTQAEMQLK